MENDIWMTTYQRDKLAGLPGVTLLSAVNQRDDGTRWLCAELAIDPGGRSDAIRTAIEIRMTPAQMRALPDLLQAHATRIETVLMPQLHPAPTIIPIALYREPETA